MYEIIKDKLGELEEKYNITILYAVESGSRAWGHHNNNSDYDIRFIYKYNNLNDYLTINDNMDVIETNDGLYDMVGWDIKKALFLHYKSNPNLREWILSPIVYVEDKINIFDNLPDFNITVLNHHYYSLAYRHYKKYIRNNHDYNIKYLKKMLYTTRCILSCKVLDKGRYPPMQLDKLLYEEDIIDEKLRNQIIILKDSYSKQKFIIKDDDIENLKSWIIESLELMKEFKDKKINKRNMDMYNESFQRIVLEEYKNNN